MTAAELENLFYKEIPISKSMGIKVLQSSSLDIVLKVNLLENKNHKGTVFGGSQYSACAIACYGLFLNGIREQGHQTNNIVIADGNIKYKAPVDQDFFVEAKWDAVIKNEFFEKLKLLSKAKVELKAQVKIDSQVKAEFNGHFVAFL